MFFLEVLYVEVTTIPKNTTEDGVQLHQLQLRNDEDWTAEGVNVILGSQ